MMRGGAFPRSLSPRPARSRAGRGLLACLVRLASLAALALAWPACRAVEGAAPATGGFQPIAKPHPTAPARLTAASSVAAAASAPTGAPERKATAAPPSAITEVASRPTSSTEDVARPGNPAAWGESAQIAVGRQFEPIYFDADSDELDVNARQRLREYAGWLQAHPQVWITLAGHADQLGSVRYSYALGLARAMAVQDFLIGQGLVPDRFYAIGFGGDLPAAEGKPEETRTLNNRVELLAFIPPVGQPGPTPIPEQKQAIPIEQKNFPAVGHSREL